MMGTEWLQLAATVRIKPEKEARQACEIAGFKWNAARKKRAGTTGTVDSTHADGVRLRWDEQSLTGGTSTTFLKMPIAALQQPGQVATTVATAGAMSYSGVSLPEERPSALPKPDGEAHGCRSSSGKDCAASNSIATEDARGRAKARR